jgi:stearoyl-CoA desaturase (Delta-9 desaturase)
MISEPPVQEAPAPVQTYTGPRPKWLWRNIIFFALTTIISVIGVPWHIMTYGFQPFHLWLTVFFILATGLSITIGYHRLFAHATFKTNPVIECLLLFFGAGAFQQSVLDWASQHREHHQYVDTNLDPYNIKRGFFYAHIGWVMFWDHDFHHDIVKDLVKKPYIQHQHKYINLWALAAGVLLPMGIGCLYGDPLGTFIFAVCFRIVFVQHGTFFINSICHTFGTATYDIHSTAKDHWIVAIVTNGEGYHNFHHRFPSDYRNGVRWYHWDPSKWIIALLGRLGLAWDIRKVSDFRIIEARIKAEQLRVHEKMLEVKEPARVQKLHSELEAQYQALILHLASWEKWSKEYRESVCVSLQKGSQNIAEKVNTAKREFQCQYRNWQSLLKSNSKFLAA